MEMYIWKRSDVISIYRKKSGKVADIHIKGTKHTTFPMSDKYIMALYTHCLVARKEAAAQSIMVDGFTEKENEMVRLENVEDVLFQALLLDDVRIEFGKIFICLNTIYTL